MKPCILVQRIYDRADLSTGRRVLVDRLWPRGVTKEDAQLDEWAKDVAPSNELRRWYGHDPQRFDEFARRYCGELREAPSSDIVTSLLGIARHGGITLLTATRDVDHSGAHVLREHLLADGQRATRAATPDDGLVREGRPVAEVHVMPHADGWVVDVEDGSLDGVVFPTDAEAIGTGRGLAQRGRVELILHGEDGEVRSRHNYGSHR
ncbi:MAG: DUF488 family protein [Acidimicrobiia bacterium]